MKPALAPGLVGLVALVALAALAATACWGGRPTAVPMPVLPLTTGESPAECLVLLLPGRGARPESFVRHGFAEVAREAGLGADLLAADAHLAYYRNQSIVDRLHADVVAGLRDRYRELWMGGYSLGAWGSLAYAFLHPEEVDGLVLIAPYVGEDELIGEIQAAGGAAAWAPGPPAEGEPFERRLWRWLGEAARGERELPPILLGYGEDDWLAPGQRLLAELLPDERVAVVPGGHGWGAWEPLWRRFAGGDVLCRAERAERAAPAGGAAG